MKRFTDTHKWRNEWFRTLPLKAKLAWTYLCDECCSAGIWKVDLGLASFQLDFKVTAQDLIDWFGPRIHFFGKDSALLVSFYGFQYGESKDTWSAKVRAKAKLESLGFEIINNEVVPPQSPHSPPTVGDGGTTRLSISISTGTGRSCIRGSAEGEAKPSEVSLADLELVYDVYPLKVGKAKGLEIARKEVRSALDLAAFQKAVDNYREEMVRHKTEPKFIKRFNNWVPEWRDWVDFVPAPSAKNYSNERDVDHDAEIAAIMGMA